MLIVPFGTFGSRKRLDLGSFAERDVVGRGDARAALRSAPRLALGGARRDADRSLGLAAALRTVAAPWSTSWARRALPRCGSVRKATAAPVAPAMMPIEARRASPGRCGSPAIRARARSPASLTSFVRIVTSVHSVLHVCTWSPVSQVSVPPIGSAGKSPAFGYTRFGPPGGGMTHDVFDPHLHRLRPHPDARHHRLGGVAREVNLWQVVQGRLGHQPRRVRLRAAAARPPGPASTSASSRRPDS